MSATEDKVRAERKEQLLRCIPDIHSYKSLLYIGARVTNGYMPQMIEDFIDKRYKIDIVEAFTPNCVDMRLVKGIDDIVNGDILEVELTGDYDVIMFWHGIEHIKKERLPELLKKLKKHVNKYIVFACPWGEYAQGQEYGNPYEEHVSTWRKHELEELGLKTDTIGVPGVKYNNLLSWYAC